MSTKASNKKAAGRIKVQIDLPALPPTKFYAGIKKKGGPKRKPLSETLQKVSHLKPVQNPYRSYTVSINYAFFHTGIPHLYHAAQQKSANPAEMK